MRIQGSGQYRLAQSDTDALHDLDHQLAKAVHAHDRQCFHDLLNQLNNLVQTKGSSIGPDELVTSETILPLKTLTLEEAQALLHDDSLLDGTAHSAQA